MNKISVIGIGPGAREYLLPIALETINSCQIIIGGARNLEAFPEFTGEKMPLPKALEDLIVFIKESKDSKRLGVIVSGDSGFYSILGFLNRHFTSEELEVIPGISSLQYFFARLKRPWQDFTFQSLHGKRIDFIKELQDKKQVALLTDNVFSPDKLAQELIKNGFFKACLMVGENLSYPEERIVCGTPEDILKAAPYQMSVVVIVNE